MSPAKWKELTKSKDARRRARQLESRTGTKGSTHVRVIQDKRFKPPKHKRTLQEMED